MSRIYEAPFTVEMFDTSVGTEFRNVVKIDCIASFTCDWNEGTPCRFQVEWFWAKSPGMLWKDRVGHGDWLHDLLLEAFVMDDDWLTDIVRDAEAH